MGTYLSSYECKNNQSLLQRTRELKIFVINLARALERRKAIEARLEKLGLEAEFVPAVDGSKLDRSTLLLSPEGEKLTSGELGCYLSHVSVWKMVIEKQLHFALVLEDDAMFNPELPRIIAELIQLNIQFDAIRLSNIQKIKGLTIARTSGGEHIILPTKNLSGSQAYLISRQGAINMLAAFMNPSLPIDDCLDNYWNYGLCIPVVSPPPVYHDLFLESTIGNRPEVKVTRNNYWTHLKRVLHSQKRKLHVHALKYFILSKRIF